MEELGTILTKLRLEKGVGQKELSACLNLSIGTISNYENNVHAPDLKTLCRLADYFGVSADYLLGRTNYRCSAKTMSHYLNAGHNMSEIINLLLALDKKSQVSALSYLGYLKEHPVTSYENFTPQNVKKTASRKTSESKSEKSTV